MLLLWVIFFFETVSLSTGLRVSLLAEIDPENASKLSRIINPVISFERFNADFLKIIGQDNHFSLSNVFLNASIETSPVYKQQLQLLLIWKIGEECF